MNIFIQPYQHIYCFYNKALIFLYDSYKNHFYELHVTEEHYQIKEGLILLENPSEYLVSKIMNLKEKSVAYVASYQKGDKLFAVDSLVRIRDNYLNIINNQRQSSTLAKSNIIEISFSLNSVYNLFTLKKTDIESQNNTLDSFLHFIIFNDFENLKLIKFICSEITASIFKHIIKTLKSKYQIELFIPFSEYISKKNIIDKYKYLNIRYSIICDDFYRHYDSLNSSSLEYFQDVTYIFIIEKESDIVFLESSNFSLNSRLKIHPIYNDNFHFLKAHIGYNKKDIFSVPLTRKQILKRELINELFWGQLFINYNGDVYSGYSLKIGNITKNDIDYRLLFTNKSFWLQTRNQFSCCSNCKYSSLCPPISMIEMTSGKVFCSLK